MSDILVEWLWDDEEIAPQTPSEVDDIIARWLAGEDVSDYEDDGSTTLTKEEADELD